MSANHTFIPWLRRGFMPTAGGETQPSLPVSLSVNEGAAQVPARLAGPGDVAALSPAVIARVSPPPQATDALPDRMAAVELTEADLPWRYSPEPPQGSKMMPWLTLVVVPTGAPGITLAQGPTDALPTLTVVGDAVAEELPDLSEAWAWAHTQAVTDGGGLSLPGDLDAHPERFLSRLLSPRRLEPGTWYTAALVPTFEAGRRAGLGLSPMVYGDPGTTLAWLPGHTEVLLPVYLSWGFRTGVAGDFEALVRRLRPQALPEAVGRLRLDASAPGLASLDGLAPEPLPLEGVLRQPIAGQPGRAPGDLGGPWPAENGGDELPALLGATLEDTGTPEAPRLPPPAYALAATSAAHVPDVGWLGALNRDPRGRAVAGLGAEVVRELQEPLVEEAWDQVAEAQAAARDVAQARLGDMTRGTLAAKHLAPILQQVEAGAAPILKVAAAAGGALPVSVDALTLGDLVSDTHVDPGVLSGPWRRLTRARGPVSRRAEGAAAPRAARFRRAPAMGQAGYGDTGWVAIRAISDLSRGPGAMSLPGGGGVVSKASVTPAGDGTSSTQRATGDGGISYIMNTEGEYPYPIPEPELPPEEPPPPPADDWPDYSTIQVPDITTSGVNLSRLMTEYGEIGPTLNSGEFVQLAAAHHGQLVNIRTLSQRSIGILMPLSIAATEPPMARVVGDALGGIGEPAPWWQLTEGAPAVELLQPLAPALIERWPELMLPGARQVPAESVGLMETNPAFIAAFMAGASDGLSRELLWRQVPADPRGTPLRRFWGGGDAAALQMPPMGAWPLSDPLGLAMGERPQAVILVRGEVIRHYPDASVYLVGASWVGGVRLPNPAVRMDPVFEDRLGADVRFAGFPLPAEELLGAASPAEGGAGYFIVLEEQVSAPGFGFDPPQPGGGAPATPNDLRWDHVTGGGPFAVIAPPTPVTFPGGATWGQDAAHVADLALQRPMRVLMHARALLS